MNKRAVDLLTAGKLDEGIAILTKALETYPNDADLAYNLACAWAKLGDDRAGLASLRDAADAGFDDAGMAEQDDDLAPLRGKPEFAGVVERIRANR